MAKNQTTPFAILLVSLAAIFIIVWGIQSTASIINPILLAVVITIVVMPIPAKLTARGLPSWLSFVLTLLAVVAVIALVLLLVFGTITPILQEILGRTTSHGFGKSVVTPDQMNQFMGAIVRWAGQALILIFTVLIIFIFMLSAAIAMPAANRLGLSSGNKALEKVTQLTEDVRSYMSIMTGVNFLVGLGDALFLWMLGVEYALLWGLLAWLMGYIPTIGFWIAMIPPLLLAWSQNGPEIALIVLAGYVLINGTVQNFIQPRMMGQGLGISPVVIFISLFIWGYLLGGIGAILAVPLTMIVMAILNAFPNTRWIAVLMSVPRSQKGDDGGGDSARQEATDKLRHTWDDVKHVFKGGGDKQQDASADSVS